jgi:hypothetical protein
VTLALGHSQNLWMIVSRGCPSWPKQVKLVGFIGIVMSRILNPSWPYNLTTCHSTWVWNFVARLNAIFNVLIFAKSIVYWSICILSSLCLPLSYLECTIPNSMDQNWAQTNYNKRVRSEPWVAFAHFSNLHSLCPTYVHRIHLKPLHNHGLKSNFAYQNFI